MTIASLPRPHTTRYDFTAQSLRPHPKSFRPIEMMNQQMHEVYDFTTKPYDRFQDVYDHVQASQAQPTAYEYFRPSPMPVRPHTTAFDRVCGLSDHN